MPNILDGYRTCASQGGKVSNPREERLHMVRNAEPQGVVDGIRNAFFDLQSLTRGEALEALYAGRPVPGLQANGIEVIDAVWDSEAMDQFSG